MPEYSERFTFTVEPPSEKASVIFNSRSVPSSNLAKRTESVLIDSSGILGACVPGNS